MYCVIKVGKQEFNLRADNYTVKLMPTFDDFGNGYIDLGKVYPKKEKLDYQVSMLCKHDREFRFWFNQDTQFVDLSNITNDIFYFGHNLDDYHIIGIHCKAFEYKVKGNSDATALTRLNIISLIVEQD